MKIKFTLMTIALLMGITGANAQNLLSNPGFEDGTTPWILKNATTAELVTDEAHSGNNSLLAQGALYYDFTDYDFTNFIKKTFTISFWYKTTEGESKILMNLSAYTADISKTLLVGKFTTTTLSETNNGWQQFTATFEPVNLDKDLSPYSILKFKIMPFAPAILIDDFSLTVNDGSSTAVTSVSLNKTTAALTVGNTEQLAATVAPTNASNKNLSWASSNTDVATVDATGLVTAVAAGTADIIVTTEDGNLTTICALTVSAAQTDNLLSNPGFENGKTSWLLEYATTAELITDEAHSGKNSLLALGDIYYDLTNYDFTDFFKKTFTVSFWYKTTEGEAGIGLGLNAYNAGFTETLWVGKFDNTTLSETNNGWQQFTATFIPENTNKSLSPYSILDLTVNISSPAILIDDFSLTVNTVNGINEVRTQLPVRIQSGNIIVTAQSGSSVEVYNALGLKLQSQTANSAETVISNLPQGQVLIVRSGNAVAKVIL